MNSGGRNVLLTYDSYSARMSLSVIEIFDARNIVVYAIPATTIGKLQPLEVVAFRFFNIALNEAIEKAQSPNDADEMVMFSFCALFRSAYYTAFTMDNIQASFRPARM